MPLIRLDEEELKQPDSVEDSSKKNKQEKGKKSKKGTRNIYPVLYVIFAVVGFGLALLVIALIRLAIGLGFTL